MVIMTMATLFLPEFAYACGSSYSDSIFAYYYGSIILALSPTLFLMFIFYIVIRFIPQYKFKGMTWVLKKTFIFGLIVLVVSTYFAIELSSSALCL